MARDVINVDRSEWLKGHDRPASPEGVKVLPKCVLISLMLFMSLYRTSQRIPIDINCNAQAMSYPQWKLAFPGGVSAVQGNGRYVSF